MISPEDLLFIYEIYGCPRIDRAASPASLIGVWNEDEFSYLFFKNLEDDYVKTIAETEGFVLGSRHEMKYCDWQSGLPPQGLTAGIICFVPRDHPQPPAGAIRLDPSVVFGDGSHPTTVACLEYMDAINRTQRITSMLDLGTGTGILALGAASLGTERVLAVDKNRLAVATALENVEANSLLAVIDVREGEARLFLDRPFDLVAANLPFQVLRDLIPSRCITIHKFWIVSGINREQSAVLQDLFADQGYRVLGQRIDHPWMTFVVANENFVDRETRFDLT